MCAGRAENPSSAAVHWLSAAREPGCTDRIFVDGILSAMCSKSAVKHLGMLEQIGANWSSISHIRAASANALHH